MSASRSITVLALNESERQALLDWSRGLDWVSWLLGGIRARLGPERAAGLRDEAAARAAWARFSREVFLPLLGPALREAWQAAQDGRTRDLQEVARELEKNLPPAEREHSRAAARILLRDTRRAAFQEVLGKHRAAIAEDRCPPHLVCVWAAAGALFQLGLANVCAEYLRLEWSLLSGQSPALREPEDDTGILALTAEILRGSRASFAAESGEPCRLRKKQG